MIKNLSKECKVTRSKNAVAAGTTDQNGDTVDMKGFRSVMFMAMLGTLTANQETSLKAQGSDDDSNWVDLADAETTEMDDDDDDKMILLDLDGVKHRYVRAVVQRGTANAVIDGLVAVQYNPMTSPTTHDADTVQESLLVVEPQAAS